MKLQELRKIIREEIYSLKERDSNTSSNPLGVAVYNFEKEVSGEEEAEEFKNEIMNLTSIEEVVDYYLEGRDWSGDSTLVETLIYLVIELGRKNLINEIIDDEDIKKVDDYGEKLDNIIDKKTKLKKENLNEGVLDDIESIMYVTHPAVRKDQFKFAKITTSSSEEKVSLNDLSQILGANPNEINTYNNFKNFMGNNFPNIDFHKFEYDIS